MNVFYNKLQEITLFELEQFNQEISNLNEAIITKEIILKNGLVIRISKWLVMDAFVNFSHKNDINSYSFDELMEMDYIPEKYQNFEFLEVYSSTFTKMEEV